jgi:hypothetical protein
MNTRILYTILLVIIVTSIGCRSSSSDSSIINAQDEPKIEEEESIEEDKPTRIQETEKTIEFDNSIIPGEVVFFVQSEFDSLRFPFEADYDHYFYNGFGGNELGSTLPYFCSGYFNNDSIIDYAVVLVQDTSYQYVIALNQIASSFDSFILTKRDLVPGDTTQGKFVSLLIRTETDKVAEHILGTYYIDNESIGISDMFASRGYWETWSNEKSQYIDLLFD